MKKILLLIAVPFIVFACSKDDSEPQGVLEENLANIPVFYASADGAPVSGTKVSLDENNLIRWNADDKITVFGAIEGGNFKPKTVNSEFEFKGVDGDRGGNFECVEPSSSTGANLSTYYAVYPYSATTSINSDAEISLTLPSEQNYKAGSFGRGANTMVAMSENAESFFLPFKNVCGWLRLLLYGDNIRVSKITIEGNNGEKIAGKAKVLAGTVPSVTMDGSATGVINLNCPDVLIGSSSANATSFIIAIPPTIFNSGFKVTVTDDLGGVFEQISTKSKTINRNRFLEMPALKVIPNYDGRYIVFDDAKFETYCLANCDDDHDGKISIAEALALNTFINVSSQGIGSLSCIKYFKNITQLACDINDIGSLDISGLTALEYLSCSNNSLTSLDVSANTALKYLNCSNNQIQELDVRNNTLLTNLKCNKNPLATLKVIETFSSLKEIDFSETLLTGFASVNGVLETLYADNCPNLASLICNSNNLSTLYLVNDSNLEMLVCGSNKLESIGLSGCTSLSWLDCHNNKLTAFDVSAFSQLTFLSINDNLLSGTFTCAGLSHLQYLHIQNNSNLKELHCGGCVLTFLDVSGNTGLETLGCVSNNLSTLDLTDNTALKYLYCSNNNLSSLDVSSNTALKQLECKNNNLTSIVFGVNSNLNSLECYGNKLATIDVSCSDENMTVVAWPQTNTLEELKVRSGMTITFQDYVGGAYHTIDPYTNYGTTIIYVVIP